MGLEAASHIDELVASNPVGATDPKSAGDDHIRMIKTILKTDFPDVDEPVGTVHPKATAPSLTLGGGTVWFDTTANLLKIRDEGDTAWITLPVSVVASNTVDIDGGTIDGVTATGNTITGGTVDNAPVGATTENTGKFTTLESTGLATLASLTVTGAINFIPAGTVALFFQAAAPTTWTQVVTHNDKAIRIVSGVGGGIGGTVAFETAFASQAVTGTNTAIALTVAQMPVHSHNEIGPTDGGGGGSGWTNAANNNTPGDTATSAAGSGDTHNHTFTGDAIDLDVQYINVILASKD